MKLQNLTIIFIIIMLPIILVLSLYITNSIKTVRYQTLYDEGLLTSAHDAIYAFEKNSRNEEDLAQNPEVKRTIIKSSVEQFKTSLANTYGISDFSSEEIEEYIPAIVFGMYDGFYLYAPSALYDSSSENIEDYTHNLKNYVYYSETLEGVGEDGSDIIIMYSLDNYITICGDWAGDEEGYQILKGYLSTEYSDGSYNGITINMEDLDGDGIRENQDGISYYELADTFTFEFSEKINSLAGYDYLKISPDNDPEDENSAFVQHKRKVIRDKIQGVLNSTITAYSNRIWGKNYKMPKISEEEWDKIYNNISMIGFFQGKELGLTEYNGYCVVNSSNSVEYVNPNLMYFIDSTNTYHDIRCSQIGSDIIGYRIGKFEKKNNEHEHEDALACYNCINASLNTDKTIYEYVTNQDTADYIKTAYWTSLGRERYSAKEVSIVDKTIDIRFSTNGGTEAAEEENKLANYNKTYNIEPGETAPDIEFPPDEANPTRTGYTFFGWSDSKTELKKLEESDPKLTARFNQTFYASWEPKKYPVTFVWNIDLNGDGDYNDEGEVKEEVQNQSYDSMINFSLTYSTSKSHYMLAGWKRKDDVDTLKEIDKINCKVQDVTNPTEDERNTYYAVWQQNKYYVRFMKNDGIMESTPYSVKDPVYYNEIVDFPTPPERENYTFMGWSKRDDEFDKVAEKITVQGNITLYAWWGHTITFDYNDDSGNKQEKIFDHNQKIDFPASPEREGHTFAGWYIDKEGNNKVEGEQKATENITYYAKWNKNKYNIKFEIGEDATGIDLELYNAEYEYLDPIKFPTETPIREGYTFEGWSTTKGERIGIKNPTATAKENVTYYACWKPQTYLIKFNLNGGEGIDLKLYNKEYEYDTVITFPTEIPTLRGNTFKGWKDENNNVITGEVKATKDVTYTAIWDPNYYEITLIDEDPTGNQTPIIDKIKASYGSRIIFPKSDQRQRTGYKLKGWKKAGTSDFTGTFEALVEDENTTYYAVWERQKYTITFYFYDDKMKEEPFHTEQYYGDPIDVPSELGTKEGHEFKGWKENNVGTVLTTEQVEAKKVPANATSYHAVWEPKKYIVTFYHNDTYHGNTETITKDYPDVEGQTYGTNVQFPSNLTQKGHNFKYWTTDREGYNQIQGTPTVQAIDVLGKGHLNDYYAQWEKKKFTITFNYSGATDTNGRDGLQLTNVEYDSKITFPEFGKRPGFVFVGWQYEDGSIVQNLENEYATYDKNMTYTAMWELKTYKIEYIRNHDKNDNTNLTANLEPKTIYYDIPTNLPTLTRTGYTFEGWSETRDGTGTTTYTVTNDSYSDDKIILYARWKINPIAEKPGIQNLYIEVPEHGSKEADCSQYPYSNLFGTFYWSCVYADVYAYFSEPIANNCSGYRIEISIKDNHKGYKNEFSIYLNSDNNYKSYTKVHFVTPRGAQTYHDGDIKVYGIDYSEKEHLLREGDIRFIADYSSKDLDVFNSTGVSSAIGKNLRAQYSYD